MSVLISSLRGAPLRFVLLLSAVAVGGCSTISDFTSDGNAGGQIEEGVDCRPLVVGEESGDVFVIYEVTNGQLGEVCFGRQRNVVEEGWEALAEVAPPEQLDNIDLFAGFTSIDTTVAFAGPIDNANESFVMAIDLNSAGADADELRLTMAHEFAHVFTQTPDQLDLDARLASCETYYNGFGCFLEGSFMADWIEEFWTEEQLATLSIKGTIDEEGGEARCVIDPTFLGAYSASHPEEDFAESFSAYVFGVDVPPALEPKMAFFDARPELAAFADRAAAADREGIDNNFDRCG